MQLNKRSIKSAVLFVNESKPDAQRMLRMVRGQLKAHGVSSWVARGQYTHAKLETADIGIALGGDGTMLYAARVLAPVSLPLFGVNSGGLGFLSGTDAAEFKHSCGALLEGKLSIENRSMISAEIIRGGRLIFGPHLALNECVIRCADQARAISLRACAGRNFFAEYFGDGMIASTPTGSTAYALAASGPIIEPSLDVLLIAPICPHALTQRPLIVPFFDPLSIHLTTRQAHTEPRVLLSLDGQRSCALKIGDEVRIRRYEKSLRLIVNPRLSYFEVLRRKLSWGER